MNCLNDLSGEELIALASILAIYLGQGRTSDELGILGNFCSALGDNFNILSSTR